MKVRLYHLAHEWSLSSTAILETLHEAGHRLKNHFAEVDQGDIEGLRGYHRIVRGTRGS